MTWNYRRVSVAPTVEVYEHRLVCQRALGRPLASRNDVHHVDGDHTNNTPRNLVICEDRAYHKLLHHRQRVVRAGGNPNTENVCRRCGVVKPLDAFSRCRANKSVGRTSDCRACCYARWQQWARRSRPRATKTERTSTEA